MKIRSLSNQGFSLVELSIVLAIIAVIVGSYISIAITKGDDAKRIQTIKKMEAIEQAITAFVALNNRLPCPASLSLLKSNTNYGVEVCNCPTASTDRTASLPSGFSGPAGGTYSYGGAIPINALGLPKEFMLDGWGNKIIYVVSNCFIPSGAACPAYYPSVTVRTMEGCNMGFLEVRDATAAARTNAAAYVLYSAGSNEYGAYAGEGTSRYSAPPGANTNETTNYNGVSNGIFVQQEHTSTYDDIVRYKMKWQIIREAGGVISTSACTYAKAVLNQVDTTYCTVGQTSSANPKCKLYMSVLANKVHEWCLNKY
jgi:prepilin-type N-terminal cleavage/methylation domain-containing protein